MDSTKEHITKEQRVLSFCYGYGGLEKGVNAVLPIKPVTYLEIEAFQNFNLVAAMESGLVDSAPIWTDIKTFDPEPFRNRVHGFIGGYPCQGESHAGKRKLWNDPRFLWPYIEKCIDTVRPFWCYFENVSGHLSGSFPYVLESLRNLGYRVEAGLFTASEVGAPHERKRLFILAMDDSADCGLERGWKGNEVKDWKSRPKENRELESRFKRSSKELGYTKGILPSRFNNRQEQKQLRRTSNELSNSTSKRNGESSQEYKTGKFIQNGYQWPARHGQTQYEWEEPRTIKPGMGCTVNGYNFRTELLRQYGNGVVSQQAEYAFRVLLEKHLS